MTFFMVPDLVYISQSLCGPSLRSPKFNIGAIKKLIKSTSLKHHGDVRTLFMFTNEGCIVNGELYLGV